VLVGEWRQPALRLFLQTITKAIVATQRQAVDNPDYSRFYKPADQFLNRDCTDADGYYIEQAFLVLL
jgi:hypothetical protein